METDFESGLGMVKEVTDQESKIVVLNKLLSIVASSQIKTQQQQYHQAYSLKAIMWMRENLFGREESFRLTEKLMELFAKAALSQAECSVELYLLNHWVKDFTIRDLCDRIAITVSNSNSDFFVPLFSWF